MYSNCVDRDQRVTATLNRHRHRHEYEGGAKFEMTTLCPRGTYNWSFEPKISRLRQTVEDYDCVNFHVIPIRDYRFVVLT